MLRKYEKYKDSGVEWIGEIPEGWECLMIKRLSPVRRGASPRPIHDQKYFDDEGEFAWVRIADVSASERYLENTTQTLSDLGASLSVKRYPDDLFLSIAGTVGKPIITKIKCCIHDGFVYFPKLELNAEYLYYLFSTGLPYQGLGKWGTQLNLNTDTVGEIVIPIPSKSETAEVVAFLDRKTAEIDQLITRKEKLIALYEEEKTAIINHAVTKGLDPKVKTKPSGIEWLGDIPEHWDVKRLKYVAKVNPTKDASINKSSDDLVVFLPMEKVQEDGSIDCELKKPISELWSGFTFFRRNDVIIAKITPCFENGKGAFLNTLDTEIGFGSTEFHVLRASKSIMPKFMYFITKSERFMKVGEAFMTGSAGQKRVPTDFVAEFNIALPPLPEQTAIVAQIETECARLDIIIAKFKKQIELFKEYRTTLISEVVTGKIDVRGEVAA